MVSYLLPNCPDHRGDAASLGEACTGQSCRCLTCESGRQVAASAVCALHTLDASSGLQLWLQAANNKNRGSAEGPDGATQIQDQPKDPSWPPIPSGPRPTFPHQKGWCPSLGLVGFEFQHVLVIAYSECPHRTRSWSVNGMLVWKMPTTHNPQPRWSTTSMNKQPLLSTTHANGPFYQTPHPKAPKCGPSDYRM